MLQIGLLFLLLLSEHVASAPPPIIYHIPFSLRPGEHGGCCGDITALNEHNGIAHLFKESGGKCALLPPNHFGCAKTRRNCWTSLSRHHDVFLDPGNCFAPTWSGGSLCYLDSVAANM